MSVLYFIFLIVLFILCICTVVSVVQFFIDLHKNSAFLSDLKATMKRMKQFLPDDEIIGGDNNE